MQSPSIAMRITALSAVLLLAGTPSVSAEPEDHETTGRVRYSGRDDAPKPTDGWLEIATPTPANHGTEFIIVDGEQGPWTKLRITASRGNPIVRSVRIEYDNKHSKVVRLDKVVTKNRPAYVDLGGARHIERVVIVSEGSARSAYAVHGASARIVARR
jgi:hypothetical protein